MATTRDTNLEDNITDDDSIYFKENMPDEQLVVALKKSIEESESWWNGDDGFNLKEVREKNVNLWLPRHLDSIEMYEHEEDNAYIDPRIFLSVETIISTVAGRLPQPEVFPATNSITSINMARDLQDGLHGWALHHDMLDKFRSTVRTLILKRVGVVKLVWNKDLGKDGDIEPVLVDVEDLVIDKNARKGENPRFIAHKQKKTVSEWVAKFPEAKSKIYEACGIKRGVASQLAKRELVYETWFTWYDNNNQPQESVAWLMKNKVIDKIKHPHWIHEGEQISDVDKNILDYPGKPFFGANHLNLGKHWIDDTTLVEQAATLQTILEKRGRQLAQNADDASGGLVVNAKMIEKTDAAALTGDPQEKIMVDGDVRMAVARIAPALLPSYVLEDKYDARNEIDNVFATHSPLRGEDTKSKTLGQDLLQSQQDQTRHDDLVRSVEFMATKLYKYVVQMMKVHYTEDHMFRMSGENGKFNFVMLNNDSIEDGVDIRVKAGSTLPMDRAALRSQSLQLAEAGLIDPLSLYETLQFPDPEKMVERLIKYKQDPKMFVDDFKQEDYERDAFANIQIINNGMETQEVKEPSAEYLNFYKDYMASGEFQDLPTETQQKHVDHIREITERLMYLAEIKSTQLPTKEEAEQANEQAVQQAAMQQAIQGGANPALAQQQPLPDTPTPTI